MPETHADFLVHPVAVPGGTLFVVTHPREPGGGHMTCAFAPDPLNVSAAIGAAVAAAMGSISDPRIDEVLTRLDTVQTKLNLLLTEGTSLMLNLSELQAEVANNTSVETSVVSLIHGLADQIAQAGTDQAAVDALVGTLKANDAALANAVAANVTPAPAPAPVPVLSDPASAPAV